MYYTKTLVIILLQNIFLLNVIYSIPSKSFNGDKLTIINDDNPPIAGLSCNFIDSTINTNNYIINIENSEFIPGYNLPQMYLIAYTNNINNYIGIAPVQFPTTSTSDENLLQSITVNVEILDLSVFELNCPESPFPYEYRETIINFNLTLAYFDDQNSLTPYFDNSTHVDLLWPESQFDIYTASLNLHMKICCGDVNLDYNGAPTSVLPFAENPDNNIKVNDLSLISNTKKSNKTRPQFSMNVYPNPSQGNLFIEVNSKCSNFKVLITDTKGVLLREFKYHDYIFSKNCRISISDLEQGIYYLILLNEDQVLESRKIIKN